MNNSVRIKTEWFLVATLILLLISFTIIQALGTYAGISHENLFKLRYVEHPLVTGLHLLSGILFISLAAFQFLKRVRLKRLGLHPQLARVLVVCALISGTYSLIIAVTFPAFGGLASETSAWFFGPLFMFAILRACGALEIKKLANIENR